MDALLDYLFKRFDLHDSRNHVSMSGSSVHHDQLEELHNILLFIRDNVELSSYYKSLIDDYCDRSVSYRYNGDN